LLRISVCGNERGDGDNDVLVFAAFLTLSFILLHTFWGIIYFDGCRNRRYYQPVIVVVLHMSLSCLVSSLR